MFFLKFLLHIKRCAFMPNAYKTSTHSYSPPQQVLSFWLHNWSLNKISIDHLVENLTVTQVGKSDFSES